MVVLQLASACPEGLLNPGNTPTAPGAPSALTATAFSATQINLAWTDNSTNEDGFRIERAPGGTMTFAEIGTVAAGVATYQSTGLTSSTAYEYRVRAYNGAGTSAYSGTATATTQLAVPSAPSNLLASGASSSQVNLVWTDNSSNEDGFRIERSTTGTTGLVEVATVGAGVIAYQNTGLTPSTGYTYRVRAYNTAGNSGYTNTAAGFTSATAVTPPAAPSALAASSASTTQINLSWTDNSTNEEDFRIERAPGGTTTFGEIGTVGPGVTSYQNTGLTAATAYAYRVRAHNTAGNSAYSATASATTDVISVPPAEPSGLTATAASSTQINLAWTDNSTDEDGFRIERAPGGTTTFAEIGTVGAGVVAYQNTGLTASTAYSYRVRAYSAAGNSDYSATANAATPGTASPPVAPSGLMATAASAAQINLAWTDNSTDEDGFRIERAPGGTTTFVEIGTVAAGATAYQSTGLAASTAYSYRVRAYNAVGNSAYSATATATTSAPAGTPPAAPSGLAATAVSATQINLAWTDNSADENGFRIERAPGGTTTFTEIADVAAGIITYQSTGLTEAAAFEYRVRAYNAAGNSAYTATATATTLPAPPDAPRELVAYGVSSNRVNMTWTDVARNEDGYRVEREPPGSKTFEEIAALGPGASRYSDLELPAGTTYTYRVRAYNAGGNSAYSNAAIATTFPNPPAAPSALTATAIAPTQIDLAWTDNSGDEDGFRIELAPDVAGPFVEIATVASGIAAYQHMGVTPGVPNVYRVRAYNAGGNSAYSGTATATTIPDPPAAPAALTATTPAIAGQIDLAWTDNSTNEDGFEVERAPGGTTAFTAIATVGAGVTTYQNASLAAATGYSYRVRAYNAGGNSGYTSTASATTLPAPPAAPSVLTATVISTTQISLAWLDNSANEDGFRIERAPGGTSSFVEIGTVGTSITQAQSIGLTPSTSYKYRVRAYNAGGNSGYSNEVTITTTLTPPNAPSGLTAVGISTSVIYIQWVDNSLNEERFHVEQSTNGGAYVDLAPGGVPAGTYGANITGLTAGYTYTYRIRAWNATGYSGYSNTASAMPTQPSQITAYPDADNILVNYTQDASKANTVFQAGENAVGCNFVLGQFALAYFCTATAFQFTTLQPQIAGRTITSAVLRLYPSSLAANFNTVYATNAFASAWNPATITWNNQPQYYTGGQSNQSPPQSGVAVDFNVTAIVQSWANLSVANNGILLRDLTVYPGTSMVQLTGFWSMDYYSNSIYRPQLIITF